MRIKLTIEYIGTFYSGWQSQSSGNTVQDKLEKALSLYFGGKFIRLWGAGRTDKGVHAKGQVAHFDAPTDEVNLYRLCLGVNLALPEDISVVRAEKVACDFDARFSAVSKTYRYGIYCSPFRKATLDIFRAQVYRELDVCKMREAAEKLQGAHDFAAFQNTGSNICGTERELYFVLVTEPEKGIIDITVKGNAFLYNMVRILAGTLVEIGSKKKDTEVIGEIFRTNRRTLAGKTMPAKGLTLMEVEY